MNPSPSNRQWLVLYQVDEGHVWFDGYEWLSVGVVRNAKVTAAVRRLWQLGLITFPRKLSEGAKPMVTAEGASLLEERNVADMLESVREQRR